MLIFYPCLREADSVSWNLRSVKEISKKILWKILLYLSNRNHFLGTMESVQSQLMFAPKSSLALQWIILLQCIVQRELFTNVASIDIDLVVFQ
jgi:hypothetical protein